MSESELEATLAFYLRLNDTIPAPEREYKFHPKRRWRFDFAWPEQRVALEVQGGIHMAKSGHNTAAGITRDCEKANEAIVTGWKVLHVTREQIENGSAINWLRRALVEQGADVAPF